jgi:hypothetical protein
MAKEEERHMGLLTPQKIVTDIKYFCCIFTVYKEGFPRRE